MTNGEAINWIINISADIGKAEHRDLWHYEQALSEIKEMLESEQPDVLDTHVGGTISRRIAIDALETIGSLDTEADKEYARSVFEALPSADKPQGEWIGEADGYSDGELVYDTWYCSNCGYVVDDEPPTWNYCPNCGSYNGGGQSD